MTAPLFTTPEEAEDAFYRAFEATDLDAMMAVWADDPTIVCIHPGGGRLRGRDEIRQAWKQIFDGGMPLRFQVTDLVTAERDDMCIRNVREQIHARGRERIAAVVLATNVYVETPAGWRLWLHHGSNPVAESGPADDDPPTLH